MSQVAEVIGTAKEDFVTENLLQCNAYCERHNGTGGRLKHISAARFCRRRPVPERNMLDTAGAHYQGEA